MTKEAVAQNNFSFDKAINAAESANKIVNQYVVSPIVNMGLAGFIFDIEDETKIEMQSDVTDHYTENNTAVQDNIVKKPEIITLRGYVGELVYRNAPEKTKIQELTEKISTINAFLPVVSASAKQARDFLASDSKKNADFFAQGVATGVDLYQTFQTLNPPKTAQARAFNFFRSLWSARQLVSLETPYTFYRNMAITAITAIQNGDNKEITDFSITLKEIRFARTRTTEFDRDKYQGRAQSEISDVQNKGQTQGETKDSNFFTGILTKTKKSLFGK